MTTSPRFIFLIILLFPFSLVAQDKGINRSDYQLNIDKTTDQITIDGLLDEPVWSIADKAGHFHRILPTDTGFAISPTEVMMAYDEKHFYLAVICYDTLPGKRPVESLRRDWSFPSNDNFIAFIDTYNDQTNGFAFGISAAGAQWDGMQADGGFVTLDWDIKWNSAVQNYQDRWVAEMQIPFRSVRYHGGIDEWGINFSRLDLKTGEKSSWAPVPRQFQSANLAFTGTLAWEEPLPESGPRFSLIPYVSGRASQDKEAGDKIKPSGSAGLDAKVILSSSMNLDLTINPDYSQVEVDEQRTNLDRFELFFPEKRQFFLENSDIFASLGAEENRPFFSRRIGLVNPVLGGARLSGKIGEKWRTGLMNMQTGAKDSLDAHNFAVAAVQRQVFARSNITAFFVNKQFSAALDDSANSGSQYNRVGGVDFNLASADNRWTGKFFYHQSMYEDMGSDAATLSGSLKYDTEKFAASLGQSFVGEDYKAEVGFIRRTGIHRTEMNTHYKFYPASKTIANHGPLFDIELYLDNEYSMSDREWQLGYQVTWLNRSNLAADIESGYLRLLEPFDPTNTGGLELPAGYESNWTEVSATYNSDNVKLLTYGLGLRYGGFFNGQRLSTEGFIGYRVQPFGSLTVSGSFNRIELPAPYQSADLVLIGPRLDITFTDKIFLTTFVQYNNQIDNINTNIRFQWRYAPVSDLYIVYTDNSWPEHMRSKNKGLVIKLSYWLN